MTILSLLQARLSRVSIASNSLKRYSRFSSTQSSNEVDSCDLHIVRSPYPSIIDATDKSLTEFVTSDWNKPGSSLLKKRAITDGSTGEMRTFQDFHNDMGAIAANLKELGVSDNSTVALFAPNHVDYMPISLAVGLCGSKVTPINPQYKSGELVTILNRSHSEVVICHWSNMDVALEAVKQVKHVKHVIVIPKDDADKGILEGTINFYSMKEHDKPIYETCSSVNDKLNHPVVLPYSSGTTGLPKGVCLSHTNMVSNLLQFDSVEGIGFPTDHKLISPLPFFHIYGFLASALYSAWRGQEVITMSERFDLELLCKLIEEHKPQRAHLVPPIMIGLCKHPVVENYDLSSINMIMSAAAPLGKETEDGVISRIGCRVKQAWGMSELSPLGIISSDFNIKSGSVGALAPDTFGKVVDPETNQSLPPGTSGELMIKGPQVMMGYLNEPDKTAECLNDGWLKTGDIAHYDEDGFFYITDRLKELIKVRGFQVPPAELENLLLTHPNVDDAAVIPIQDEEAGELPKAYVCKKSDEESQRITDVEIQDWVKERVAPYKRINGGVEFIDEIPKSASGKILRRLLVEKEVSA